MRYRHSHILMLTFAILGCSIPDSSPRLVFADRVPAGGKAARRLKYLERTHKLPQEEKNAFEKKIADAETSVGVPRQVLWCLLFQDGHLDPDKKESPTEILTVAALLKERYDSFKNSLDRHAITYDSNLLWIYATAAYKKGLRPVYALFTHEWVSHGVKSLNQLVSLPKSARNLLTRPKNLHYSLSRIWAPEAFESSIWDFTSSMDEILTCVLPTRGFL